MKNFLLFIYDFEYPKGGFKDFSGAFKTERSARKAAQEALAAKAREWECDQDQVEMGWHIFHIPSRNVITWSKRTPLRSIHTKGIF